MSNAYLVDVADGVDKTYALSLIRVSETRSTSMLMIPAFRMMQGIEEFQWSEPIPQLAQKMEKQQHTMTQTQTQQLPENANLLQKMLAYCLCNANLERHLVMKPRKNFNSHDVADIVYSAVKRNGRIIESFTETSNN